MSAICWLQIRYYLRSTYRAYMLCVAMAVPDVDPCLQLIMKYCERARLRSVIYVLTRFYDRDLPTCELEDIPTWVLVPTYLTYNCKFRIIFESQLARDKLCYPLSHIYTSRQVYVLYSNLVVYIYISRSLAFKF